MKHNVDRELYKILNGAESEHINLEGPFEPDRWRMPDGMLADGRMGPSAFELVNFLWKQKDKTATLNLISDAIRDDTDLPHIRQYMKEANNLFRTGVKWHMKSKVDQSRRL